MSQNFKESHSKNLERIDEEPISKNIPKNLPELKYEDSLKLLASR